MFSGILLLSLLVNLATSQSDYAFTYNGFRDANMTLNGIAEITPNGLLRLTNTTNLAVKGHAFHSSPLHFKNSSTGEVFSFSTVFAFAIVNRYADINGHGMAFAISPSASLPNAVAAQHLGLFNLSNMGDSSNHIVAVELDTGRNSEFGDINDNHVGIDNNSLLSARSSPAEYFPDENGGFRNLSLSSGKIMQVWIEYSGSDQQLNVTLFPANNPKPDQPLLSLNVDLSSILLDSMYVGFSSSAGTFISSHYVLGWSFKMNGDAESLDLSRLPPLPRTVPKETSRFLTIGLPLIVVFLLIMAVCTVVLIIKRRNKFAEIREDWEQEYGPHRFSFKDLYIATKGFREKELLGIGGFGRVYRGILPASGIEVAVKRVSHESRQGMVEFVAEIVSLGRLRHRNLVQLLGYCRRKGELLLVYDFMPNGSLDKFIFDQPKISLNWSQRLRIIKGVASGLLYLHEEWEKAVLHRDIKASNVLIDGEFNGRLGDFGLARLYDHDTDPRTTQLVGTLGYIAPELTSTGKATTSTDVFAFGIFMLEVACGRRPISLRGSPEEPILLDRVLECWRRGAILEATDPKLGSDYVAEEMELVLKLGLLCSRNEPGTRPTMRQVKQFLDMVDSRLELSDGLSGNVSAEGHSQSFVEQGISYPSSDNNFLAVDSLLTGGR